MANSVYNYQDLDRLREIVVERIGDPSQRLHGFCEISDNQLVTSTDTNTLVVGEKKRGCVLFPYAQILHQFATKHDSTKMIDDWYKRGHLGIVLNGKLLARSTQRLGESEGRYVAVDRFRTVEINTQSDLNLDYNAILMQLRILTDCVGFTLFPIINGTEPRSGIRGFRDVLKKVIGSTSKPNGPEFRNIERFLNANGFGVDPTDDLYHKREWFDRLAGFGKGKSPGLRDAITHHAAFQMFTGPRKDAEGNFLPNTIDGILVGMKGPYTKESLFSEIRQIIDGFFLFLDAATREVWEREKLEIPLGFNTNLRIPIEGDSRYIRQLIPIIPTSS
jgi:hypothetical protein